MLNTDPTGLRPEATDAEVNAHHARNIIADQEQRDADAAAERAAAERIAAKVKLTEPMRLAMWRNAAPTMSVGRSVYPADIRDCKLTANTWAALVTRGLVKPWALMPGTFREFGHAFTLAGFAWLRQQVEAAEREAYAQERIAEMAAPGYALDDAAVNVLRFFSVEEYATTPTGPVSVSPGTFDGLRALGLLTDRPRFGRKLKHLVLTPAGRAAMLAHDEALAYLDEQQIGEVHHRSLDEMRSMPFNGVTVPTFALFAAAAIEHRWFTAIVVEAGPDAYGETTFRCWDDGMTDPDGNWSVGGRWVRYSFWSSRSRVDEVDELHAEARITNLFVAFMGGLVDGNVAADSPDGARFSRWCRRHAAQNRAGASLRRRTYLDWFLTDEAEAHQDDELNLWPLDPTYGLRPQDEFRALGSCMHCDDPAVAFGVGEYGDRPGQLCRRHARPRAILTA